MSSDHVCACVCVCVQYIIVSVIGEYIFYSPAGPVDREHRKTKETRLVRVCETETWGGNRFENRKFTLSTATPVR